MLEISLPGIFEDQGSGYPLRVSKVTLKWTDPVRILTKGQLESNLSSPLPTTYLLTYYFPNNLLLSFLPTKYLLTYYLTTYLLVTYYLPTNILLIY